MERIKMSDSVKESGERANVIDEVSKDDSYSSDTDTDSDDEYDAEMMTDGFENKIIFEIFDTQKNKITTDELKNQLTEYEKLKGSEMIDEKMMLAVSTGKFNLIKSIRNFIFYIFDGYKEEKMDCYVFSVDQEILDGDKMKITVKLMGRDCQLTHEALDALYAKKKQQIEEWKKTLPHAMPVKGEEIATEKMELQKFDDLTYPISCIMPQDYEREKNDHYAVVLTNLFSYVLHDYKVIEAETIRILFEEKKKVSFGVRIRFPESESMEIDCMNKRIREWQKVVEEKYQIKIQEIDFHLEDSKN